MTDQIIARLRARFPVGLELGGLSEARSVSPSTVRSPVCRPVPPASGTPRPHRPINCDRRAAAAGRAEGR